MTDAPTPAPGTSAKSMDDIVALCRRRGFIWQSSEIYGGINGFWDYGPLGAQLKKNIRDAWWQDVVTCPPDGPDGHPLQIVPVDCTIIMNPKVWEASGHVGGFNDLRVDCRETNNRYRADQISVMVSWDTEAGSGDESSDAIQRLFAFTANDQESYEAARKKAEKYAKHIGVKVAKNPATWPLTHAEFEGAFDYVVGPDTERPGTLTEPRQFNLMFKTHCGAVEDEESLAYLRPETAQGIFTQFWNVVDTSRVKVPFGIAQMGKAFRNEVTPRNFTFRSREFEQMEIEFFIVHPEALQPGDLTPTDWYQYWCDQRFAWWQSIGLAGSNLQLREHEKDELSHYAKEGAGTSDIEYRFPFTAPGFGELEGVAHRTDFDLRQHAEHCGQGDRAKYFDQDRKARYFPHVIEPSAGADRGTLAVLCEAYTPDPSRPSGVYMNFTPRMAPIKAGIFPLVAKDGMPEIAEKLYRDLRERWAVQFDVKQSIGKRYARMDEAGTPYCFTIDGETVSGGDSGGTVTVRHRDTQQQDRIAIDKVAQFLAEKIG